ncbi:MAG: type VI secretion system tip protein VgrG [Luteitalea sp.]|nr:type VI secretion system tip protein VgrG [Luteitalea sp.]
MPRVMEITTPLGDDVLLFHGMHAREEMSRLFEYQLDLLSTRGDVNLDEILGKNVTVKVALPDDSTRYFNGYVTRLAQSGMFGRYHRYSAVVRPWLWFLTRTADCRIFQDMAVPDIIKAVFGDHTTADFKLELTSTYRTWNYCVQYRETDFNFVSRLMEHEGIYYYFRHTDGHNTLVLTDSTSKHTASPGYEQLPFIAPAQLVRPDIEHIGSWELTREIQPGVYVHDDYDLERPSVELKTRKVLSRSYAPSDYEIYDYPGHYLQAPDGEQYAAVRVDELGSQFETADASTNARGLTVGCLLTLDRHPRADQNREHLILAASYDLEFSEYEAMPEGEGSSYRCNFVAMASQQQFRPKRLTPKPFMQGPQTAVVVGPAGEEIYKDDYERVKVQFHWDRYGKRDENSSCWIRVSQPWAGKGWGSVSTPRIGHEVIVDFLEGDPDQPIIMGSVYNADNMPPHGGVVSGLKSNTHKGSGYNELSMDDTAGKEQVTIHGQYDMSTTVEHDQTTTVNNDQTTTVNNNRAATVAVNDTLNVNADRTVSVKGKLAETIDTGQETTITAGYTETITGGATSTITGDLTSSVTGKWQNTITGPVEEVITAGENQNITGEKKVTVMGGLTETVTGLRTMDVNGFIDQKATAGISAHADGPAMYTSGSMLTLNGGGSLVTITAGAITIMAAGSVITVNAAGVSVNGTKISLNC